MIVKNKTKSSDIRKAKNFDALLDIKYGKAGTKTREDFEKRSRDFVDSEIVKRETGKQKKMNVASLIEVLKTFPPESRVVVEGYEEGYDDIQTIKLIPIRLNAYKEDWRGPHKKSKSARAKKAVVIIGDERNYKG